MSQREPREAGAPIREAARLWPPDWPAHNEWKLPDKHREPIKKMLEPYMKEGDIGDVLRRVENAGRMYRLQKHVWAEWPLAAVVKAALLPLGAWARQGQELLAGLEYPAEVEFKRRFRAEFAAWAGPERLWLTLQPRLELQTELMLIERIVYADDGRPLEAKDGRPIEGEINVVFPVLINIWKDAGGEPGVDQDGPFGRFVKACFAAFDPARKTPNVRYWVRKTQKRSKA